MPDPFTPWPGCETHEWRSALGETVRFVTRTEAEARMMPPVTIHEIAVPDTQGARFNGARHESRLALLPVVIPGPQSDRDELRRWAAALDPTKGEGTLTVVDGDWAGRQLVCLYETGLETFVEEFPGIGLSVLGFRASDPYWRDASESEVIGTLGQAVNRWFPFAGTWAAQPLVLSASDVFAVLTIDNTGDVPTWPLIEVQGPGNELTVTNQTTGKVLKLTGVIAAGSAVRIDTRPGAKSVTIDGVNAFPRLTPDSSLWPIIPGLNKVSIAFASADANSSVRFAWRRRWLAA